jgi:serine phosphatase RsbU (regulator of sigma subunit)
MDRQKKEFGEQRLLDTVKKYSGGTATEVLNGIFKDVKIFSKAEKSHDDMTMVVVKIV